MISLKIKLQHAVFKALCQNTTTSKENQVETTENVRLKTADQDSWLNCKQTKVGKLNG